MLQINVEPLSDRGASVISRAGLMGVPSCRNTGSDRRWTDVRSRWNLSEPEEQWYLVSSMDTIGLCEEYLFLRTIDPYTYIYWGYGSLLTPARWN